MKYVTEFRDQHLAHQLAQTIAAEVDPSRSYRLMEFCGGHTHAIFRYGVQQLMPPNLRFVHGPGCPVCVLPMARLDQALALLHEYDVTLCTYGDLLRVPASGRQTLLKAKAAGADVRMIYSTQDVLQIARTEPHRQIVFLAIGFETTTPPTAVLLEQARALQLKNLSVLCNHVLTPPALRAILTPSLEHAMPLDGILGPSHVSTIIGTAPYECVPRDFHVPVVIAGFEPLDVMQAALMLVRQLNAGRCVVENQYRRAVSAAGNLRARELMARVFVIRSSFEWRGLGFLPDSVLALAADYADFDAERRFPVSVITAPEPSGCDCPAILRGLKEPTQCRLFGSACTPDHPIGACMVSSEGACAAYWTHRAYLAPTAAAET
ncbi:hydrogenase expression/formation protein HypD [Allochromatium warmingii]|uniref:Hydrogenase maturation factor n=1 Tax=Allochromatium warmingii TaxID=61595 RepID=A0A1H3FBE2_ALLWA|nr:hydrogenase formation protein HypD [Allochromatium warmingii]SDX87688.1 hydrogenase expression/formation protein HypD [Allochromatium warmingii]